MSDKKLIEEYNYEVFHHTNFSQWMMWDKSPLVGIQAPDFPLWQLDQTETSLSSLWGEHKFLIVEFGSFT